MNSESTRHTTDANRLESTLTLLRSARRRRALAVLADRDSPTSVEELAAAVAVREADAEEAPAATVGEVAETLHHVHLPKLAAAGAVAYAPEAKAVMPARIGEYEPFLDATVDGR